jgi:hypothetical protein
MSLQKNGAAVHFILSDSILGLLEIPNSVCINGPVRSPPNPIPRLNPVNPLIPQFPP